MHAEARFYQLEKQTTEVSHHSKRSKSIHVHMAVLSSKQ